MDRCAPERHREWKTLVYSSCDRPLDISSDTNVQPAAKTRSRRRETGKRAWRGDGGGIHRLAIAFAISPKFASAGNSSLLLCSDL